MGQSPFLIETAPYTILVWLAIAAERGAPAAAGYQSSHSRLTLTNQENGSSATDKTSSKISQDKCLRAT
jgi:hypothetical protein